jgi:carbonic anhydrase/acetyltransferase-like protein (isoleucine patch superfamily)
VKKHLLIAAIGLLPASSVKNALLRRLGWKLAKDAIIGPGIYLRIRVVSLGPGSSIGPFNVVRDLVEFTLEEGASIGQWNWFSAAAPLIHAVGGPRVGRFRLGRHASIASRHYLDASGGIDIGELGGMAGARSTVITHGVDMLESRQSVRGCTIGDRSIVGSNVKLVPGAHVPPRSVVAMGSVVTPGLTEPDSLYCGVPAKRAKDIPPGRFIARQSGPVELPLPYGS